MNLEFRKLDLNSKDLQIGDILFAKKSSDYYRVTEKAQSAKGTKYSIQQINGEDTKSLSKSTLERWYSLVLGFQQEPVQQELPVDEVVEEPVVEEVVAETTPPETPVQEIEPEIQPATPPARQTRKAPNSQQADPVLQQVRQRIIDQVLADCQNAVSKETSSYTGLKVGKYNFGEVANGKKRFTVRVISKSLDQEALAICNIAPPSYGWTLDATYTVLTEQDFDNAVNLLKASYAYRLANTPNR